MGALILLAIIILTTIRAISKSNKKDNSIFASFLFIFLKAYIVYSIFKFPFDIPTENFQFIYKKSIELVQTFIAFSLVYYSFFAGQKDRQKLINMFKLYITAGVVLFTLIITLENNINLLKLDFHKTRIQYSEIDKKEENIKSYEEYMDSLIKVGEVEKKTTDELIKEAIDEEFKENNTPEKNDKDEKEKINIFLNFVTCLIGILTLLVYLWSLNELSLFKYFRLKKFFKKEEKRYKTNNYIRKINRQC